MGRDTSGLAQRMKSAWHKEWEHHLPAGPDFVREGGVAERADDATDNVEFDIAQPLPHPERG